MLSEIESDGGDTLYRAKTVGICRYVESVVKGVAIIPEVGEIPARQGEIKLTKFILYPGIHEEIRLVVILCKLRPVERQIAIYLQSFLPGTPTPYH